MTERVGHFTTTFTGRQFWPLDPRPEDVCIEDVAHHLSLICRFGGATPSLYSVAQHSVLVSRWLGRLEVERPRQLCLWGLLHDGAEAYVGDMVWPLKRAPGLAGFSTIEAVVMRAIVVRFDLLPEEPEFVKQADLVLLATEKRDLMGPRSVCHGNTKHEVSHAKHAGRLAWGTDVEPMAERIFPWPPDIAEGAFLERFAELGGRQ